MAKITYADKSAINENAGVAATNKVQASDMNEIKSVVNGLINNSYTTGSEAGYSADYINDLIRVETTTINAGTISAGGEKFDQTTNITIPTGYQAIGIVGYITSGTNYTRITINRLGLVSSNTKIGWSARNNSNVDITSLTIAVSVMFLKTSS